MKMRTQPMSSSKTYRPDMLKPDFSSAYFELSGPSIPDGMIQGDGLVRYLWRYFDVLEGTEFPYTLQLLKSELTEIMAKTKWPEAKGVVFQFDILETGTTTFGEVYIDLADNSSRQVLYDLRSRDVRLSVFPNIDVLITQLSWMPANLKPEGKGDLVQVSLV